jgi:hypothetical protein
MDIDILPPDVVVMIGGWLRHWLGQWLRQGVCVCRAGLIVARADGE